MTKYYALINPQGKVYDVFATERLMTQFIEVCVNPLHKDKWDSKVLGFAPCLHCIGCQPGMPSDYCPQAVSHGGPPDWMRYLGEPLEDDNVSK